MADGKRAQSVEKTSCCSILSRSGKINGPSKRIIEEHSETTPLLPAQNTCKSILLLIREPAIFFAVLGVGITACMYFEGWTFVASLYVVTQVITTVGYGEFTVTSDGMRIFMAFYVLACLVILAYYLNLYLQQVVDWQSDSIRRYLRQLEREADNELVGATDQQVRAKYGAVNKVAATAILFLLSVAFGTIFFRLYEHCACPDSLQERKGCKDTDYATCVATGGYTKGYTEAFYMSVITMTTVGFGDYQPRTEVGRLVGCVWMLLGVVITVTCLNALSLYFLEANSNTTFQAKDLVEGIDEQTFEKIDRNHDGRLTRGEFLSYTLLKYGLVNEELLGEINNAFDKLDVGDTNAVTLAMIQERCRVRQKKAGV